MPIGKIEWAVEKGATNTILLFLLRIGLVWFGFRRSYTLLKSSSLPLILGVCLSHPFTLFVLAVRKIYR